MTPDPNDKIFTPDMIARNFPPATVMRERPFRLMAVAALAGLAGAGLNLGLAPSISGRARYARRSVVCRPSVLSSLHASSAPEKYTGQRRAHLVGAHRPMTAAEIAAHNADLAARKAGAA